MAKITLGYWDIRGLAEPIRYLLHYKNVKFEDKRYAFDSGEWQNDKFNLGLDFPNLPYLFDGDVKITQSKTILRYLAQKYHLDGNTEKEKLQVSMLEQQIFDLFFGMIRATIPDNAEEIKAVFIEGAPPHFKLFETFLGDKNFLIGDNVTYVDFMASETFDFYRYLFPEVIGEFPTLIAFQKRVSGLPELQEYLNSSTYKRWPIFGPIAKFGGGGEEPERD